MLVALILGFLIARAKSRAAKLLDVVVNLPMALPAVVMGIAMLWFFVRWLRMFSARS